MIVRAIASYVVLVAWFAGPAALAMLALDRWDAVRADRAAVEASRQARLARKDGRHAY